MERFLLALIVVVPAAIVGTVILIPEPPPCVRTERQTVVSYPNMAFLSFGGAYTALALMPSYSEAEVCVERAEK